MESVSRLASYMDIAMLLERGVTICPEGTPDDHVTLAVDLVDQLGSRFLIKYVRESDLPRYSSLSGITFFPGRHFVTPTPIAAADLEVALNLPHLPSPMGALLLRPDKLNDVRGPRRIAAGLGIEYILDSGFSIDAVVEPQWAVRYA